MTERIVVVTTVVVLAVGSIVPAAGADKATLCAKGSAVTPADGTLKPGQTRTYAVDLTGEQVKAAPSLKFAAYLVFPGGEAGTASALKVAVNATALTAEHHPTNKPKTFSMPNHHSRGRKWPLYDPTVKAWVLCYDRDVMPPAKGTTYYTPGMTNYVFAFPAGPLWKTGRNVVEITNAGKSHPIRVLSVPSHDEQFARASERFKTVPTDRFLPACRAFKPPTPAEVKKRFGLCHKLMESIYNGDGSWGKGYSDWPGLKRPQCTHPLVRWTARPVLGYLIAHRVEPNDLYLRRAKEGLNWLLVEQTPSGAFRWYWEPQGTVSADSLYDTAIAGRALVAGYEQFKDKRYLAASGKAAKWAMAQPVSGNANYDFFTVWHQAAHYRVTKDKAVLASAVRRAVQTLKNQQPNGMWSDRHNQIIYYHAIIVRGLVELLTVLPKDHAQYETIRKGTFRAVNHFIVEQSVNGLPRRQPTGGISDVNTTGAALTLPALMLGQRRLGWRLDEVIFGLASADMKVDPKKRDTWISGLCITLWWQAAAWDWAATQAKQ